MHKQDVPHSPHPRARLMHGGMTSRPGRAPHEIHPGACVRWPRHRLDASSILSVRRRPLIIRTIIDKRWVKQHEAAWRCVQACFISQAPSWNHGCQSDGISPSFTRWISCPYIIFDQHENRRVAEWKLTSADSLMIVGTPLSFHLDVRAGLDGVLHLPNARPSGHGTDLGRTAAHSGFWPT